ncbi:MAG TPA: NADH-quinone oxidoreductase subunit H, partial [Candidatus Thermoplasmatota archaeon]|nr:NADH-quinone oxidoreductase subunit H [Candidatus Thermoplasmatota archaeon]
PLLTPHIIPPVFIFLLKSYLVFAVFVWIRSAYPRLRTDQLLNTGWKRLLPATLVNIAVAGFLVVDQVRPGEVVQTPFGPMSQETVVAWVVGAFTFLAVAALYSMHLLPRVLQPLVSTARMFVQTLGWFGGRPFTVLYPYERLEVPLSERWLHGLSDEKCISCARCCRICPDNCLNMVESQMGQHPDPRFTTRPALDASHCMFCGLCVEVCPTGALTMGPNFELAGFSRDELYWSQDQLMGYDKKTMQEHPAKGEIEVVTWVDKLLYPLLTPVLQFVTPHNYERAKGSHSDANVVSSAVRELAGGKEDERELGLIMDNMSPRSKKAVEMLLAEMRTRRQGPRDVSAWDLRHERKHEPKGSGFGETAPEEDEAA